MSKETIATLNTSTLIGYTKKRGNAWHYRAEEQGAESNHYEGSIPVEDVTRRLFDWKAIEGTMSVTALHDDGILVAPNAEDFRPFMRSDTGRILGIFKAGYVAHQYDEWLVKNVGNILDSDLQIGSAGVLKQGAQAWVQIEMAETLEVQGVEFRPFLTAATSMDGSLATTYMTGSQVVVCDNTLSAALKGSEERIKVYHSRNSLARLQDAREALKIVYSVADTFTAQVEALTSEFVSDETWKKFTAAWAGYDESKDAPQGTAKGKIADLEQMWNNDLRVAPWKNNAYGVLAAVNTYTHHGLTVRGATRPERNAARVITGGVDKLDQSTLELLAAVR